MRWRRVLVAGAGLLLAAGVAAPFVNADRFAERIRKGLQQALRRPVTIGPARFELLTGPGFTLSEVIISEDPAYGIEPFAYVTSLRARVRIGSLLLGRLEFSSLQLDEPSVNLVRNPSGAWSIQPFVEAIVAGSRTEAATRIPEFSVRRGRLNFKLEGVKSVFYITNADIDITEGAEEGSFRIRFEGQPARTDRTGQGLGQISARGRWAFAGPESRLSLSVDLERSRIAEVMVLLAGRDYGVHGLATSRARLEGPLSNLALTGELVLSDLHRWDLMPSRGASWPLRYRGRLDLGKAQLELQTESPQEAPVSMAVRAWNLLSQVRWAISMSFRHLPAPPFLELVRQAGVPLPPDLRVTGSVEGGLVYSQGSALRGSIRVRDGSVGAGEQPPLSFPEAALLVDGGQVRLAPMEVRREDSAARVEASFDMHEVLLGRPPGIQWKMETAGASLTATQEAVRGLLKVESLPFLEACQGGVIRGTLGYARRAGERPEWTAALDLERVRVNLPDLGEPVLLEGGWLVLRGQRAVLTRLRARAGPVRVAGDYRYEPALRRPHRVQLSIPDLDLAAAETLVRPALRRDQSFLARTLGLRRNPLPEWLRQRYVEGQVEVKTMRVAGFALEDWRSDFVWDAAVLRLTRVAFRAGGGSVSGSAEIRVAQGQPEYRADGVAVNIAWKGGRVDTDFHVETRGSGADLLTNLSVDGSLEARSLALDGEWRFDRVSGCYRMEMGRSGPSWTLSSIEALAGGSTYSGWGASERDGTLLVELSGPAGAIRVSGLWTALAVSPASP